MTVKLDVTHWLHSCEKQMNSQSFDTNRSRMKVSDVGRGQSGSEY